MKKFTILIIILLTCTASYTKQFNASETKEIKSIIKGLTDSYSIKRGRSCRFIEFDENYALTEYFDTKPATMTAPIENLKYYDADGNKNDDFVGKSNTFMYQWYSKRQYRGYDYGYRILNYKKQSATGQTSPDGNETIVLKIFCPASTVENMSKDKNGLCSGCGLNNHFIYYDSNTDTKYMPLPGFGIKEFK